MKILSATILLFILGTMFVSLFHMSANMDMSMGMTDCPFMSHDEVICPMNLADHIGAWKSVFLAVAPTITLFLAAAGLLATAVTVAPNVLRISKRILCKQYCYPPERTYTFSYRPLQELFSKGILHPKLF
jgi:hypothetical protein